MSLFRLLFTFYIGCSETAVPTVFLVHFAFYERSVLLVCARALFLLYYSIRSEECSNAYSMIISTQLKYYLAFSMETSPRFFEFRVSFEENNILWLVNLLQLCVYV